jgi:hypothetical protein
MATRGTEFVQLQRYWYARLKQDGFKDIEILQDNGEFYPLLNGTSVPKRLSEGDTVRQFYVLAGRFCQTYSFKTKTQARIWTLYCEGKPYRAIASQLRTKLCRVYKVIQTIKTGPFEEFVKQEAISQMDEVLCG